MEMPTSDSTKQAAPPAVRCGRPYEPPRLTGKRALEQVTLFSFVCTPPDPNCQIGRP